MVSEVQFSFDALSFLKEALPEQEAPKPTESLVTRKAPTVEPVKAQDENQTMLRDFATRLNDRYDLASINQQKPSIDYRSSMIQEYLDSIEEYSRDDQMRSAIDKALMEATRPPIGQLSETARTAMFSSADMRGTELAMMDNARQAQNVVQPMITPVSRGEQPEMADSPAPVDTPSIDARSNEMLDKPKGIMTDPRGNKRPKARPESVEDPFFKRATEFLTLNEGFRNEPYKDSRGFWTIGIGHLITRDSKLPDKWKGVKLTDEQVTDLFKKDYDKHLEEAKKFSVYNKLNEEGRLALLDLTFNMGTSKFNESKWPNFFKALESEDLDTAAAELKNSRWFNQVKSRAPRVISLIKNAQFI